MVGGTGPDGVPGDLVHDLRHTARACRGAAAETRTATVCSPQEVPEQALSRTGARQLRQERLQEMRQWRASWPLLVSVPAQGERTRSYERVRRQGAARDARRGVRYPRRSTGVELVGLILMYTYTPPRPRSYISHAKAGFANFSYEQTVLSAVIQLDRPGDAEHFTRAVHGLQADVGLGGMHLDNGLEALSGGCREGLQLVRTGPGQHLPGGHLRGAVPTCVDGHLVVGSALGGDGGVVGRLPAPGIAEGPVGFPFGREGGAEEQLSIMAELREDRRAAPAHKDVPVRQHLHAALGVGEQLVGVGVLAQQGGPHLVFVDLDHDAAGLYLSGHVTIVEDGDLTVGVAAGVVLESGPGAGTHLEVALLPAQTPDDLSRLSVDLVHGGGVAGGDEQVILIVYVYGVDVEVVVGLGVRRVEADVLEAVPLEDDLTALDVDLLDDPVEHVTVYRIADRDAVPWHLVVDRDQGRILGRDEELVVVTLVSVAGPEPLYLAVGVVADDVLALAVAGVASLPPGQNRLPLVRLRFEVHHVHILVLQEAQPHGLSIVVEDHAPVLPRTVLVGSVLRGDKDAARSGIARRRGHLDDRGVEIRTRAEAPSLPHRAGRGGGPGAWGRIAAQGADERGPGRAAGRGLQEPPARDLWVQVGAS